MNESFCERNFLSCFGFYRDTENKASKQERHTYESHKVLRRNLLLFLHREDLRGLPKCISWKAQNMETPNKAYS